MNVECQYIVYFNVTPVEIKKINFIKLTVIAKLPSANIKLRLRKSLETYQFSNYLSIDKRSLMNTSKSKITNQTDSSPIKTKIIRQSGIIVPEHLWRMPTVHITTIVPQFSEKVLNIIKRMRLKARLYVSFKLAREKAKKNVDLNHLK